MIKMEAAVRQAGIKLLSPEVRRGRRPALCEREAVAHLQ